MPCLIFVSSWTYSARARTHLPILSLLLEHLEPFLGLTHSQCGDTFLRKRHIIGTVAPLTKWTDSTL